MALRPTTGTIVAATPANEKWIRALGGTTIPLRSRVAVAGSMPNGVPTAFYLLDVSRLTDEQRDRVVAQIADDAGLPVASVREGLDAQGFIPVLAADVSVETIAGAVS